MKKTARTIRPGHAAGAGTVALVAATVFLGFFSRPARASYWPDGDWKNHNHKLKVCLQGDNCPAGMADSVQAAIGLWNAENLTWKFEYVTDCSQADITIKCKSNASLGTTYWGIRNKENTSARVEIDSDADWGWCNDKYELVSTITHELGHCARLKDEPASDQTKVMRGAQGKPGHHRGPSSADSTEAATSDTAGVPTVTTEPSHAQKQTTYSGVITPSEVGGPLFLDRAVSVDLRAFLPDQLHILEFFPDPVQDVIYWQAFLNSTTNDMQLFHVEIQYDTGGPPQIREGHLYVTDVPWSPSALPHAVAPDDTTVATDSSPILLDYTASSHPLGDVVSYAWLVDHCTGIQGGPVTSITLPTGIHMIELIAVDHAGDEDRDTMMVTVLMPSGGAEENNEHGELMLSFPTPYEIGGPNMSIALETAAPGPISLRVYDVQGRLVRTIWSGTLGEGRHLVDWDLRDGAGRQVPAGVYLCSVQTKTTVTTRKLILMK